MCIAGGKKYVMGDFLIHHVAISTSTNLDALELAENGTEDGVVVLADEQSAGMGRNKKVWRSPRGNLYFSVILRGALHIPALSFVAAIAVGTALEEVFLHHNDQQSKSTCCPRVEYKWPNDVMVNGRKISGVLLQTKTLGGGHISWVVCGIGINVYSSPISTSTSIKEYVPCISLSNAELMEIVLKNFRKFLDAYNTYGFSVLRNLWLNKAYSLGKTVQIVTNTNTCHVGKFVNINTDGAMVLQSNSSLLSIGYGKML